MARKDLETHFQTVERLINEIEEFVPDGQKGVSQFRSDLAGLVVVSMVSSYESCVKETLVNYSFKRNREFGEFSEKNFGKLNSRIMPNDLRRYAGLFSADIQQDFNAKLRERREKIERRGGKNIESSFKQILSWRHDFAHAGKNNTTIKEAAELHTFAKRVVLVFDSVFETA